MRLQLQPLTEFRYKALRIPMTDQKELQRDIFNRLQALAATMPEQLPARGWVPIMFVRELDGTGSYHPAAQGDPGAFPVYIIAAPPAPKETRT
jgi:hypothetical protein